MTPFAALPLLAALAATPAVPTAAVVVTRRAGMTPAQGAVLARRVHDALSQEEGLKMALSPDEALAKLPPLQITDRPLCAKPDCLANLGVLLGVQVVVGLEVGQLGEAVALHLEAVTTDKAERVASQDLSGNLEALSAGRGMNLEQFASAIARSAPAQVAPPPPPPVELHPAPAPASAPPVAIEVSTNREAVRTTGWVFDGVGGACLVSALAVGLVAKKSYNAADAAAKSGQPGWQDLKDKTKRQMNAADALWGVGGAVAATGVVLTIVGWKMPATVTVTPVQGGAGVVASGTF